MSQPETDALSPLKRVDGEPLFDEPWQAQALAMADTLVAAGVFSASLWSDTLGDELKQAAAAGEADDITTYYEAVLKALQRLLGQHADISEALIARQRDAWAQAYHDTPHGQPVKLSQGIS